MAHDSLGAKNQPQYSGSGVPADAADLSEIANYAAAIGNRKADASTVRTGLTGADVWPGLQFYETDTALTYVYVSGTGWVLATSTGTVFTETGEATKATAVGQTTTVASVTLTIAYPQSVEIAFTSQGQVNSPGINWAGNLILRVDGTQVGGTRRFSSLTASGNTPINLDRTVRARLAAGSRVITAAVAVDSASGGYPFVNNPQFEIWAV